MDEQRFLDLSADYLGEYLGKISSSVATLTEAQVWWRPNDASNSVGNLLLHLAGNLSEWILASLGGVVFERHRDAEFRAKEGRSKEELLAALSDVVASCQKVVRGLTATNLAKRFTIHGDEVDGLEAVYHVVDHMSYHTGQIAYVAKELAAKDLALT